MNKYRTTLNLVRYTEEVDEEGNEVKTRLLDERVLMELEAEDDADLRQAEEATENHYSALCTIYGG